MEDWQHSAVTDRVQELDAFPGAFERSCLRLAVPDHCDGDEIGVIEDSAEGMHEDVAEFSALVYGAGGRDADVAWDTARRRELAEEAPQAHGVLRHVRIDLGVGPFQIDVRDDRGAAVSRAGQVDHVGIRVLDQAVQVHVDEAEARRGSPVSQQPGFDVFRPQRLAQQRILLQIDLANRQIISGAPVAVHVLQAVRCVPWSPPVRSFWMMDS